MLGTRVTLAQLFLVPGARQKLGLSLGALPASQLPAPKASCFPRRPNLLIRLPICCTPCAATLSAMPACSAGARHGGFYLPSSAAPGEQLPTALVLHGSSGDGERIMAWFARWAEANKARLAAQSSVALQFVTQRLVPGPMRGRQLRVAGTRALPCRPGRCSSPPAQRAGLRPLPLRLQPGRQPVKAILYSLLLCFARPSRRAPLSPLPQRKQPYLPAACRFLRWPPPLPTQPTGAALTSRQRWPAWTPPLRGRGWQSTPLRC